MMKKKVIKNEGEFKKWFIKNYHKLGYSGIVRKDIGACPDFIMLKNGKEVLVELETLSSNFLTHKHPLNKVDEVVCVLRDSELGLPIIVAEDLQFKGNPNMKVTLSLDSKVYSDFQKYCEENAIMLSKKIEILMKTIMKPKNKKASFLYMNKTSVIICLVIFILLAMPILYFLRNNVSDFVSITGFAVFEQKNESDFSLGTYVNTTHNGSAVILSGTNISGIFTSKIFDATSIARWNNLSWQGSLPTIKFIFAVDNQADVWKSIDSGVNWSLIKDDYNGGDGNGVTSSFFNSTQDFFIIYNQAVWTSQDNSVTWTKINDDYNGAEGQNAYVATVDKNNNLFIIEGDQDVWKSTDSGVSWTKVSTDFNGGNGNFFGFAVDSYNNLFAVDNQADVWKSIDSGVNWSLIKDDYNGGSGNNVDGMAIDSNNILYIIDLQDVWQSTDSGLNWTKVNDDFNGAADAENAKSIITDSNNYIYIIDGGEDVFKSIDNGATFTKIATNFNGANGVAPTMATILKKTNLTLQARACSLADCSDETWQNNNLSNINLTGRYFQYRVYFSSQDSGITPLLYNVSIDYTILDNLPPLFLNYSENPTNNSEYASGRFYEFNVTITEENLNKISIEFQGVNYTNDNITNISNVFSFNRTDLAAGAYSYYWWANDTLGNYNTSSMRSYTINRAENNIALLSSAGWNYNYGTETTFSCYAVYGNPSLYINNTEVSNPKTIVLSAGLHDIKCNISESQNYTSEMSQGTLTINKISSQTSLTFDKTSPQVYGTSITTTCSKITGEGNLTLSLNGNIITSGQAIVLGAGVWNFNCSLAESQNYSAYENLSSFTINKTNGNISLHLNRQESNILIDYPQQYNITATTLYGNISIYMNGTDITTNNSINVTPSRNSAYYNITAVSSGDQNHSSATITKWLNVTLDIDSPEINLVLPQEGESFGYNLSLQLNFSVSDMHLDSCWYNLNNGNNITLSNCKNTSFNASADGTYTVYLYANDSLGNLAVKNSTFSVFVGAPTITLNSPIGIYLNSNTTAFRYIPRDLDLNSCELWGDFAGNFSLNQTNNNPLSDMENIFYLNLSDGNYKWNIRCNDSIGHSVFNGNKTFYVDTTKPNITISQPSGTKTSRTEIPLQFSITDASPVSCKYNVRFTTGQEALANTTISNCSETNFNLSVDGDYILDLFITDFATNFNSASSLFSISTSQPPVNPPSGGGGGGGSGGAVITNKTINKIEISKISNLIVNPGETKKLTLGVKNAGTGFLNDCKLKGIGEYSSWVKSENVKGLSAGERYIFIFTLNIPEKVQPDKYDIRLLIDCQEYGESTNFSAEIIEKKLSIKLISVEKEKKDSLKITYSLTEISGTEQTAEVEIILFGDGNRLAETKETKRIHANSKQEYETHFKIPSYLNGDYNLLISVNSDIFSTFIQENVVIAPISGLAVLLNSNKINFFVSILIFAFLSALVFLLIKRIIRLKKVEKHQNEFRAKYRIRTQGKI